MAVDTIGNNRAEILAERFQREIEGGNVPSKYHNELAKAYMEGAKAASRNPFLLEAMKRELEELGYKF